MLVMLSLPVVCLAIVSKIYIIIFFFKQKTSYEMRISDWSSDVCSSDLRFTLSGFWGYTDASFDKFIDPFTGADLSNQDFARVPKNNWRLTGSVDLKIGRASCRERVCQYV